MKLIRGNKALIGQLINIYKRAAKQKVKQLNEEAQDLQLFGMP